MKIGYVRGLPADQSLEMQLNALKKANCERIFTEIAYSAKDERIELQKAFHVLQQGDILVIYKLDRLVHSTKKLIEVYEQLITRGVELISICDGLDTTTLTGQAMFKMIGVIAELEREKIIERTKAGLQAARARGRNGGRPKTDNQRIERAIHLYDAHKYSIADIEHLTGVKKATLYRALKHREIAN
ncbi:MAG: tnpR [Bacilli bacterium]|nr:tnpR [Bacilli bacterium]